jgi:vancomycin resistance protein YoaR
MKKLRKWWVESKTWQHVLLGMGLVFFLYLAGVLVIRVANKDKILPGVIVRGVYIGGLNKSEALQKLNNKTSSYLDGTVTYFVDGEARTFKPSEIGVSFDNNVIVDEAYATGRSGNLLADMAVQTALPFTSEDLMQINLDQEKYSQAMVGLNNLLAQPTQNASYSIDGSSLAVIPEKNGRHIDMGLAMIGLSRQMSDLKQQVDLPLVQTKADVSRPNLERQKDKVSRMVASPVKLIYSDKSWDLTQKRILSWLSNESNYIPATTNLLNHYYPIDSSWGDLTINRTLLASFLNELAGQINVEAVDAQLNIEGGRATVFKQSRDGVLLNIPNSAKEISEALKQGANSTISLAVDVKKADVSDDNIDNLGIKELISEGISYFPGSTWQRMQNIRVGTARYQGVLIKPGQVFSFGEYLGEVGPAQGYAESKVILDGKQEFQYGGGLCQVSSTMFRAALNAGLPIVARTNHAFQVSYYTQPYGVPGVDATIYYPAVDLKFKNDTNKHILVQADLTGTTLVFRFYGTKEKEGRVRGPFFNFGSLDPNIPSQTTFYRDVLKDGQVVKTDSFSTYYKSALDFPTAN